MTDAFAEITSFGALCAAALRAARGKRSKPGVARFLMDLEGLCLAQQRSLRDGTWQASAGRSHWIRDPKPRYITVVPFGDRVVEHALMATIGPRLEAQAFAWSFACRKGGGAQRALARTRRLALRYPHVWRTDIAHFFATIPHDRLFLSLRDAVPEADVRALIEGIVKARAPAADRGLCLGALTSQLLANHYLTALDARLPGTPARPRAAVRYMDDVCVFGSLADLRALRRETTTWLAQELSLSVHPRIDQLVAVRTGVPFLGWQVRRGSVVPRPATRRRMRRRARVLARLLAIGRIDEATAAVRMGALAAWRDGALRGATMELDLEARPASRDGVSPSATNRVYRGGSWNNDADNARVAYRNYNDPTNANDNLGVRLVSSETWARSRTAIGFPRSAKVPTR